jgi:hypothetical protein
MAGTLSDLLKNTLLIVGALFPTVNPIGNAPIFLSFNARAVQPVPNRAGKDDRPERPDSDPHLDLHWYPHPDVLWHLAARGAGRRRAGGDFNWLGAPSGFRREGSDMLRL